MMRALTNPRFVWSVVLLSVLAPVLAVRFLPLNDYPFHLARMVILADLDDPVLDQFYFAGSMLIPNMAMDAVVLTLAPALGAETASRVFVALTLASLVCGVAALHRVVHGRSSPWPLLAAALLFNTILRFGFLNYLFGLGVAFLCASLSYASAPGWKRRAVNLIASLLLMFLHLSAFAVFAVVAVSIELYQAWRKLRNTELREATRTAGLSVVPFVLALMVLTLVSPTAQRAGARIVYPDYLGAKPYGVFYSMLSDIRWLDTLTFFTLLGVFVVMLVGRKLEVSPPLALGSAMLGVCYLVLPSSALGTYFVDVRLVPAIALAGIAACDYKPGERRRRVVALAAMTLAALHGVAVTHAWRGYEPTIQRIVTAMAPIERGSTVFAATDEPTPRILAHRPAHQAAWRPPLKHVASYAVLNEAVFVPMTYADPTSQPLGVEPAYAPVKAFQRSDPRVVRTPKAASDFVESIHAERRRGDWPLMEHVYVLFLFRATGMHVPPLPDASVVSKGDLFVLLRLSMRASGREVGP